MSVRIYQLSKKIGISNKELLQLLQTRGFDVASASSSIADIYAEDLEREFGKSGKKEDRAEKKQQPEKVAIVRQKKVEEKQRPETPQKSVVKTNEEGRKTPPSGPMIKPAPVARTRIQPQAPVTQSAKNENKNFGEGRKIQGFQSISYGSRSANTPEQKLPEPSGSLLRKVEEAPRVQRPKMIPLERLQVSLQQQNRRFARDRDNNTNGPRRAGSGGGNDRFRGRQDNNRPNPNANVRIQRRLEAPKLPVRLPLPQQVNEVPIKNGESKKLRIKLPVTVRDFAPSLGLKPFQLISELMRMNIFASMNFLIEEALAQKLASQFGYELESAPVPPPRVIAKAREKAEKKAQPEAKLEPRPPIVCVLGHVDHGKTTLLDAIRKTNVVAGEAGGITQHIGAYGVKHNGCDISFIDTPGHAAFSKMRERGANITDVAILVVAADDGFMPQTDEALKFARNAGVPVVVAINKADVKGANIDRVKQQMQQRNITSEDWGGETLCCPISALKGEGLSELLDAVLLQAEMLQLKADPHAPVRAVVIESQLEVGRGPTASVIVEEGTIKEGTFLVSGTHYCKVRAMSDDRGKRVKSAGPSAAVKIMGWSGVIEASAEIVEVENEKEARRLAEQNGEIGPLEEEAEQQEISRGFQQRRTNSKEGLDALFAAINAKQKKTLHVVLKCDVQGTLEVLRSCLEALPQGKVSLNVVSASVGPVLKSDVEFAQHSGATIVAFDVKNENGVAALLKRYSIPLIQHNIIYELIDQVRDAMADLLDPEFHEEKLGAAQIRQVFELSRAIIAGCMVTEGKITRESLVRLRRDGKVVHEGKMNSLKRGKEDVQEVRAGFECGLALHGYSDYHEGDVVECYKIIKIRSNL